MAVNAAGFVRNVAWRDLRVVLPYSTTMNIVASTGDGLERNGCPLHDGLRGPAVVRPGIVSAFATLDTTLLRTIQGSSHALLLVFLREYVP